MKANTSKLLQLAFAVGAIRTGGEFTLSSGAKSDRYFEGKLLTLHPEGACLVGKAIYHILENLEVDAVGGLVMGAIPIVTAVSVVSYQKGKPIPSFIVRETPKEHGTKRQVEGHIKPGYKVAIVDDVVTQGNSIDKAIKAVQDMGCKVVKVIAIVDRHEGGGEKLRARYNFAALIDFLPDGTVRSNVIDRTERESTEGILRPQPV
jgi:orotate phosphoribosyltransferase